MTSELVHALLEQLQDNNADTQQDAAIQLVELGGVAVDAVIHALGTSPHAQVRTLCAWALGEIGDARAVVPLLHALYDVEPRVQDWVTKALGELGDLRAVDPLIQALGARSPNVRRHAAAALGWLGDTRAVSALITALDDKSPDVRASAAEGLGKLKDPQAVKPLIALSRDGDDWVRVRVAYALYELKHPSALQTFLRLISDRHEWVRTHAANALGDLAAPACFAPLRDHLRADPSPNVRRACAISLGKLGGDAAVEVLVSALADTEDIVLEAVDQALQQLGYSIDT